MEGILKDVAGEGFSLKVYGSVATGLITPYSDIDLSIEYPSDY